MIDISIQNLQKYYGGKPVLTDVSFTVQAGEHVGLLGANGAGKTTLFRLLSGEEPPDGGYFSLSKKAGVLSQIPDVPASFTVRDVMDEAFAALREMERRMADLEQEMGCRGGLPSPVGAQSAPLREYGELLHRYEDAGGYETARRVSVVRQGLQIDDALYARPFHLLSGGEKTRINLARLMLEDSAILLLDEPTNHLDVASAEWLEEFLSDYKGTALMISHDRFFLDNTVTRVVELEDGKSTVYNGGYSFFAREKERRQAEAEERYQREQREYKRLTDTARRMHDYAGKNDKLHRRAFAIEKRAERIPVTERPKKQAELRQKFHSSPLRSDDVLRAVDVSKRFGEHVVLHPATLTVSPGDRIALLGANGAGKTTLLKLLTGELPSDSGTVRPGPAVRPAVLPQSVTFERPERTLYDTMLYAGFTPQDARNRLGGFHFRNEDVFKTVDVLSGGERSRLALCLLMREETNFLLLDEPTNHLDIQSREWIEEAVEAFDQTLLFISHDRYFTARFATRIWALENGALTDFHGTYEEYRMWLSLHSAEAPVGRAAPARRPSKPDEAKSARAERVRNKEMLEKLKEIDRRFGEIEEALGQPGVYTDPERMTALLREQKEIAPVTEAYRALTRAEAQEEEARAMLEDEDPEVRALAYEECGALAEKKERLLEDLKKLLLPRDPDDRKNVIIEIRGGVGGEEAALFAATLWRMYSMYAERRRWKAEVLSSNETELGGIKELQAQITGEGAYSRLKYESGAHRVQRVPDTESQGRVHTSAATVAVLPEAEEVDVEINPDDLDVITCRAGGAGGQHVNKTESAIRIVHKPTGLVVECQDERSQHKNKDKAMKVLRAKLYEKKQRELDEARGSERRSQVGSGDRSERVRTYNFPQGRVTDHRVNLTLYKIQSVIDGDLDELIDTLAAADQAAQLAGSGG